MRVCCKADIYGSISNCCLIEIKNLTTTADVWKKLCALHQNKSEIVAVDIQAHLQSLQMQDGGTPSRNGEDARGIILYTSKMIFTLLSVSCIDNTGMAIHIDSGMCKIITPAPKLKVIA
jgi:hypothetical protein